MPLFEKARIEVYLPDIPDKNYQDMVSTFDREFCHAFGGATIVRGLDGSYLSHAGRQIHDPINLVYADTPFSLRDHFDLIARYTEKLNKAVLAALEEEAVLVVVMAVYHSV